LESSLRNLAAGQKIVWSGASSISKINTEIYKANVYDKVIWAEIEAWGRLRNQVEHGDFKNPDDVDAGAAKRMVDGVLAFAMKYR
jgi:hypothetical protein